MKHAIVAALLLAAAIPSQAATLAISKQRIPAAIALSDGPCPEGVGNRAVWVWNRADMPHSKGCWIADKNTITILWTGEREHGRPVTKMTYSWADFGPPTD